MGFHSSGISGRNFQELIITTSTKSKFSITSSGEAFKSWQASAI
jgi:hypothetical protein